MLWAVLLAHAAWAAAATAPTVSARRCASSSYELVGGLDAWPHGSVAANATCCVEEEEGEEEEGEEEEEEEGWLYETEVVRDEYIVKLTGYHAPAALAQLLRGGGPKEEEEMWTIVPRTNVGAHLPTDFAVVRVHCRKDGEAGDAGESCRAAVVRGLVAKAGVRSVTPQRMVTRVLQSHHRRLAVSHDTVRELKAEADDYGEAGEAVRANGGGGGGGGEADDEAEVGGAAAENPPPLQRRSSGEIGQITDLFDVQTLWKKGEGG